MMSTVGAKKPTTKKFVDSSDNVQAKAGKPRQFLESTEVKTINVSKKLSGSSTVQSASVKTPQTNTIGKSMTMVKNSVLQTKTKNLSDGFQNKTRVHPSYGKAEVMLEPKKPSSRTVFKAKDTNVKLALINKSQQSVDSVRQFTIPTLENSKNPQARMSYVALPRQAPIRQDDAIKKFASVGRGESTPRSIVSERTPGNVQPQMYQKIQARDERIENRKRAQEAFRERQEKIKQKNKDLLDRIVAIKHTGVA